MKKLLNLTVKIITFPLLIIGLGLIYFYKFCISPLLPHVCRFTPTCSTYALQSIKKFGIIKGSYLSVKRIISCNPWHKGAHVCPVPDNIKGEIKWIL